jgi:hypothetical protein
MITAKENVVLLADLLYVHLAPPSLQAIKRARRMYRELIHSTYPITEEALAANLDETRAHVERMPTVDDIATGADHMTVPTTLLQRRLKPVDPKTASTRSPAFYQIDILAML